MYESSQYIYCNSSIYTVNNCNFHSVSETGLRMKLVFILIAISHGMTKFDWDAGKCWMQFRVGHNQTFFFRVTLLFVLTKSPIAQEALLEKGMFGSVLPGK